MEVSYDKTERALLAAAVLTTAAMLPHSVYAVPMSMSSYALDNICVICGSNGGCNGIQYTPGVCQSITVSSEGGFDQNCAAACGE